MPAALRRCLKRVDHSIIKGINKVHDQLGLKMFHFQPRTSLLFDLDSSVLTIYGTFIEEAKVGYNPHKKGGRFYHPLLCFESHARDFRHGVLRPGDAYTAFGLSRILERMSCQDAALCLLHTLKGGFRLLTTNLSNLSTKKKLVILL